MNKVKKLLDALTEKQEAIFKYIAIELWGKRREIKNYDLIRRAIYVKTNTLSMIVKVLKSPRKFESGAENPCPEEMRRWYLENKTYESMDLECYNEFANICNKFKTLEAANMRRPQDKAPPRQKVDIQYVHNCLKRPINRDCEEFLNKVLELYDYVAPYNGECKKRIRVFEKAVRICIEEYKNAPGRILEVKQKALIKISALPIEEKILGINEIIHSILKFLGILPEIKRINDLKKINKIGTFFVAGSVMKLKEVCDEAPRLLFAGRK